MDDHFFQQLAEEDALAQKLSERDALAADAIYYELFEQQQGVIDDPYEYKALLTPRRSGKTHTAIAYSIIECLRNPGAIVIIVTLTLKSAKKLYWDAILGFSDKYGLNLRRPGGVHHTNAEARFENGSQLYLMGAETKSEIEKLRGGSYDLVIVDECKSFAEHIFQELIDDILSPACQDRGGTLFILGTPGNILAGPFYEATYPYAKKTTVINGKKIDYPVSRLYSNPGEFWENPPLDEDGDPFEPEWSRHTWTQKENTRTKNDLWKSSLRKKKSKKWADDNPTWLREHLGQWISMGDAMVYAYARIVTADKGLDATRCTYRRGTGAGFNRHGLPDSEEWRYVLGMDLGYEDDLAIVVAAYSPNIDKMYIVHEFKQPHMIISEIATQIEHLQRVFEDKIEAMVVDTGAGGKQLVESMNAMYGTYLVRADKTAKTDYIELLNSDLYDAKLLVLPDGELAREWLNLQWDLSSKTKTELVRTGRLKEDPKCANHLSDAALYTWRFCLHHFSRDKINAPVEGTEEYYDEMDYEDAVAAAQERNRIAAQGEWGTPGHTLDPEFDQEWNLDTSWLR
jgi:hypothetical protein